MRAGLRLGLLAVALTVGAGHARADEVIVTKPCDITVMISGAFSPAFAELGPAFEKARGKTLCTIAGPSMGETPQAIPNRLARGEADDVVILARASLDSLLASGALVKGSGVDLIRSQITMAVKAGAPKPDISTSDTFKAALLGAKSIAYSDSASGVYIKTEMYKAMGLDDQLAPKSRMIPATPVGIELAQDRAEIGFQQMSELLPIPGIDIVGPIPAPWQRITVFSAGVSAKAKHPEEAKALIAYLASPAAWPTIRKTGVEPAGAGK